VAVSEIRVESGHNGAVRTIVLDRAAKRNALTPGMFEYLIELFTAPPPAREQVTLLRAEGTVFCAGVDLSERIQNGWPQESPLVRLCEAMRRYPVPIVAALQGDAIAGGTMMTLHADLVIAAAGARIGMPLAQLGIAPPWVLTARTIARCGPALGREMVLVGYPIPVERLLAANAINAVYPREEFPGAVDRLVDRLARNAPLSLRAVKGSLASLDAIHVDDPHVAENALVRAALDSRDAKEGMAARLERREPNFSGS
jgi:enoyl-CoA hydratase/carnithine racemase